MLHQLKTWPVYFAPVADTSMTFQVRKLDRDYNVGDHLLLREWDPAKQEFTGRQVERRVTMIFDGTKLLADERAPVLRAGYGILGIVPVPYGQSMVEDQRPAHVAGLRP